MPLAEDQRGAVLSPTTSHRQDYTDLFQVRARNSVSGIANVTDFRFRQVEEF